MWRHRVLHPPYIVPLPGPRWCLRQLVDSSVLTDRVRTSLDTSPSPPHRHVRWGPGGMSPVGSALPPHAPHTAQVVSVPVARALQSLYEASKVDEDTQLSLSSLVQVSTARQEADRARPPPLAPQRSAAREVFEVRAAACACASVLSRSNCVYLLHGQAPWSPGLASALTPPRNMFSPKSEVATRPAVRRAPARLCTPSAAWPPRAG